MLSPLFLLPSAPTPVRTPPVSSLAPAPVLRSPFWSLVWRPGERTVWKRSCRCCRLACQAPLRLKTPRPSSSTRAWPSAWSWAACITNISGRLNGISETHVDAAFLLLVCYLMVSFFSSGVSAHKDADLLLNSLDALERCSFRPDLEYK